MDYVIASSRPWHADMANRLSRRTGRRFHLCVSKQELTLEWLKKINPRYVFFPHWSYRIPEEIFSTYECVIFHMTDLPYGRGGSPLQNLILRGHHETVISAIRCEAELDAGPIYLKYPLSLQGSASDIFWVSGKIVEDMVNQIIESEMTPLPQEGAPTYFSRRSQEQSNIDDVSIDSLEGFYDFIRMLDADGYPRAFVDLHGYRLELSRAQMQEGRLIGTFAIYKPISEGAQDTVSKKVYSKDKS